MNIVIIGSGMGGLVAGNILAREGHKVTIFESHTSPGGYTAGFWRKGFYFESGTLSFESSNTVFKALKDAGVYDKLTFEKHSYRFLAKDFDASPDGYEDYKNKILAANPSDKERIERYFRDVDKLYKPMASLMGKSSMVQKLAAALAFAIQWLKYRNVTITEFTGRYFEKGSVLLRRFSKMGYPDMSALLIGGAFYSLFEDYWTIKEGFQALADTMIENFKQRGGMLLLNSPVDKILTREGTAVGVRCKGEEHPADVVIAACDYKETFLKLLDPENVPAQLREKVSSSAVSEGITAIYLGLSLSNEELLIKLGRQYVLCDDSSSDTDIQDTNDEKYFEKAGFSIFALSTKDPRLAPQGKSSVMIEIGAPYRWMNNWGGDDRSVYIKLKNQVLETVITKLNDIFPGIKEAIEFKDIGTPRTFERYTKNTDGATSAWSWNPKKKFHKSILGTYIDTPVKRLYVGSCWATQIGGVPGAINAAYACVKRIKGI